MRIFAKIVLTVLFIVFSLTFAVSATLRFQLLNANFWKSSFEKNDTYSSLVGVIQSDLVKQVTVQGGKSGDIKILTDLVTKENLKNFINKNLENSLNFLNGKSKEINVYLPISRIPKSLLPDKLVSTSEEMSLQEFLKETGVTWISDSQIAEARMTGFTIDIIFLLSACFAITIFLILFKLDASSLALILSGIVILISSKLLDVIKFYLTNGVSLAKVIMATTVPPILSGISRVWVIGSVVLIVLGIILFLIKKRYTKSI